MAVNLSKSSGVSLAKATHTTARPVIAEPTPVSAVPPAPQPAPPLAPPAPPAAPPALAAPPTMPAGWYLDPALGRQRWWDGVQWGVMAPPRPPKTSGIAYLLAILLGGFGAHNFYLGRIGPAVGMLVLWLLGWLTVGIYVGIAALLGALVWWIIDLVRIPAYVQAANSAV